MSHGNGGSLPIAVVILGLGVVLAACALWVFQGDGDGFSRIEEPVATVDVAAEETGEVRRSPGDAMAPRQKAPPATGTREAVVDTSERPRRRPALAVKGSVVEKGSHRPVEGASVALLRNPMKKARESLLAPRLCEWADLSNDPLSKVSTGQDGTFVFSPVKPGEYIVLVRAKGFGERFSSGFVVAPEGVTVPLEIALSRGVRYEGDVRNVQGHPVAGVRVGLLDVRRPAFSVLRTYQEMTDEKGHFVFESLEPGVYAGSLTAEGYGVTGMGVLPIGLGGEPKSSFTLEPEGEVFGRVFDAATQEGLENAKVFALVSLENRFLPAHVAARSGKDGAYVLRGIPARGEIVVGARVPGFSLDLGRNPTSRLAPGIRLGARARSGGRDLVDLPMLGGATVEGRVVEKGSRRPIEGARVVVFTPQSVGGMLASTVAKTDSGGRFRIESVPAGDFVVAATHPDYVAGTLGNPTAHLHSLLSSGPERNPHATRLAPGELRDDIVLAMSAGVRISGRVAGPDGASVQGAEVVYEVNTPAARGLARLGLLRRVTTDAEGRFELVSVPPVKGIVVRATHPEFLSAAEATLDLPDGESPESLVLRLGHGARVAGTVLRSDGTPSPGVEVRLAPERNSLPTWVNREGRLGYPTPTKSATADDQGRFHFDGIPAGRYVIYLDEGARTEVSLAAGELKTVTVRQPGNVLLRGTVFRADGRLLPGAVVLIDPREGASTGEVSVTMEIRSDAEGRFSVTVKEGKVYFLNALAVTKEEQGDGTVKTVRWRLPRRLRIVAGQQGELRLVLAEE